MSRESVDRSPRPGCAPRAAFALCAAGGLGGTLNCSDERGARAASSCVRGPSCPVAQRLASFSTSHPPGALRRIAFAGWASPTRQLVPDWKAGSSTTRGCFGALAGRLAAAAGDSFRHDVSLFASACADSASRLTGAPVSAGPTCRQSANGPGGPDRDARLNLLQNLSPCV